MKWKPTECSPGFRLTPSPGCKTVFSFSPFFSLQFSDSLTGLWRSFGALSMEYAIIEQAAMDEKEFFDERPEKKMATLNCPHCHQAAEYEVTWIVRTKKRQLAGRADERDRARFAKARSYMLRKDDLMACKNMRCRKRFEISGLQSVVFTE